MGSSGSGMGKKMVNPRGHKVKNAYAANTAGMMNPHMGGLNQEYLNSLLSPSMMGQNYLSQTQGNGMRNSHGFAQNSGGTHEGRRTQQDMQKQKASNLGNRPGNQTQLQMYSQKQNLINPQHQANILMGQNSHQDASHGGQASDPNSKNTVNINMNIMNIGLQGQLIGVNGPVQASHNMIGMNGIGGVGQKPEFNNNGAGNQTQ